HRWTLDCAEGEAVARENQWIIRCRIAWDGDRTDVELVVPNQQEFVDELLRDVHRRYGVRDACDGHVDRGLLEREGVDEAVRGLRRESDRGVRWIGSDGPSHLHALARHVRRQIDRGPGRDLSVGFPALA